MLEEGDRGDALEPKGGTSSSDEGNPFWCDLSLSLILEMSGRLHVLVDAWFAHRKVLPKVYYIRKVLSA